MSNTAPAKASPVYRIGRALVFFAYAFALVAIVILTIAFFLKLFNASTTAPFVQWVYRATTHIMQPFRGIFPSVEGETGSVLDVSILFGILMYGLLALGLHALITWIDAKLEAVRHDQWLRKQQEAPSAHLPVPTPSSYPERPVTPGSGSGPAP
jgi:uncharacterized protein YggT (Ycf19 family)